MVISASEKSVVAGDGVLVTVQQGDGRGDHLGPGEGFLQLGVDHGAADAVQFPLRPPDHDGGGGGGHRTQDIVVFRHRKAVDIHRHRQFPVQFPVEGHGDGLRGDTHHGAVRGGGVEFQVIGPRPGDIGKAGGDLDILRHQVPHLDDAALHLDRDPGVRPLDDVEPQAGEGGGGGGDRDVLHRHHPLLIRPGVDDHEPGQHSRQKREDRRAAGFLQKAGAFCRQLHFLVLLNSFFLSAAFSFSSATNSR